MAAVYSIGLGFFGALAAFFFTCLDQTAARWSHAHNRTLFNRIMQWLTETGEGVYWLVPSAILALWYWLVARRRQPAAAWAIAFVCLALTGIATNLAKVVIGRARPQGILDERRFINGEPFFGFQPGTVGYLFNSMPSGHATTCGAVAALAWLYLPRGRWLLVPLMLLVSSSRVFVTAHYPSDVALGFYVGAALSLLIHHAAVGAGWIASPPAWRPRALTNT